MLSLQMSVPFSQHSSLIPQRSSLVQQLIIRNIQEIAIFYSWYK